jgi:HJR/Mrr/RecB family endonuclease
VVLTRTISTEFFGGTMGDVAGSGTVWNGWRHLEQIEVPPELADLWEKREPGDLQVDIWNEYGSDVFHFLEGRDYEVVPWSTPLIVGISPVVPSKALLHHFLDISLGEVNRKLIDFLACNPRYIHELSPRKFEELVAELLSDMGYEVRLTPQTRDGGRDVLVVCRVPPDRKLLFLVECKRLAPHKSLGVDVVQRLLWIVDREDRANGGLIVTTSHFSTQATKKAQEYGWRMSLYDFQHLREWLSLYGKWDTEKFTGLWLPRT